ncbi:MAG: Fe-S cluster assembly protein SufB [Anaerolineae bacterium]|nr:Fe-S cluster assembly protein SufB [Anaerolineae bacterium]
MTQFDKSTFDIGASSSTYREKYGFYDPEKYVFKARKGLNRDVVEEISWMKNEPEWMRQFRLRALELFEQRPMPRWGADLSEINFDDIYYFVRATEKTERSWDDVPEQIKRTFDRLGIPEAERKFLAGVGAQYECLSGDTRVYTARGLVPIKDVMPGDTVFSFDEESNQIIATKVKATAAKGTRQVFEVRVGTRTIKATDNHPFLVLEHRQDLGKLRGRYHRVWKYLHELKPGDLVAVAKQLPEVGETATLRHPNIKTQVLGRNQSVTYTLDISERYNPITLPEHPSSDLWVFTLPQEQKLEFPDTSFRAHTNEYVGFVKIDSIAPAGMEPVYDIEVDGPHNFVAEGLIVHNSEVVYHNIQENLKKQGVIFLGMDQGLAEYPDLVKKYFGTVIPPSDNKFAALNSAVWSGGSFIYVPPGVRVEMPLQAYFRINAQNMGQFERTLIIADEGSYVHYVEGCFLAGARVRTRDGEKPIEEIRVGDEVLTHRGRYRRVYRTMQRPYSGAIYHIRYYGDSSQALHVTAEHPLLVVRRERANERNRRFEPEWLTAADLKPGDYLTIPVPQPETTSSSYDTTVRIGRGRHAPVERSVSLALEPDLFRLFGYYFSEGHVDNEHYLSFSFNTQETAYLQDVKELTQRYFGKAMIENKPRQSGQTLVLSSTPVARLFANEFGSTVYDKRIPDWVQNASLDCLAELVRGMWRGDGSYDPKKNMFRYSSVSRHLAYAFRDALLRLGIAASVNIQMREEPRQDLFTVVVSSPWNSKFGAIVGQPAPDGRHSGSPFYLDEHYLYVPIRAIEMEEMNTTVYNFSVEEDESYIGEGVISHNCTAPIYSSDSLHSAVVEIIVHKGARVRYTTIQNWSMNVYNLVTKRAVAYEDATMEWVDCNLGSKVTMKYPSVYMMGKGARGEILSVAFAGRGQHQDAGGKVVHGAPYTSSLVTSKSISKDGGRTSYRGLLKVYPGCEGVKSNVRCDALLLDEQSRSDTYPYIEVDEDNVQIGHEASVSKIGEEQLFYLMSRGLSEAEAATMIVAGFIEPIVKELPMEYAVELNRLIALQMEGSVG